MGAAVLAPHGACRSVSGPKAPGVCVHRLDPVPYLLAAYLCKRPSVGLGFGENLDGSEGAIPPHPQSFRTRSLGLILANAGRCWLILADAGRAVVVCMFLFVLEVCGRGGGRNLRDEILQKVAENETKFQENCITNPSNIDLNDAQECSKSDPGSQSFPESRFGVYPDLDFWTLGATWPILGAILARTDPEGGQKIIHFR